MISKVSEENKKLLYKYYVTDTLYMIAENTAKLVGDGGRYAAVSFQDILNKPKTLQKTGAQILEDITKKMGLEVINDGLT